MAETVYSINKLRSKIGEFAKGHRYSVIITPPAFLSTSTVPDLLQYVCEAVSLPTKGIASNAHDIYGTPREIPYRETFTESALSFFIDDDFNVKRFFDQWQANIINPESGNVNYWNNFVGNIKIARLKNDSIDMTAAPEQKYEIELVDAYPSAVGEIALGHTQGGEVLRLSVTFKYRRWNTIAPGTSQQPVVTSFSSDVG